MRKLLIAVLMASGAAVVPARAHAADAAKPQKLSDAQLDDVTGGMGPPSFVLEAGHGPAGVAAPLSPAGVSQSGQVNVAFNDINVNLNLGPNASANLATTFQLSLLSQQPQAASATAFQQSH